MWIYISAALAASNIITVILIIVIIRKKKLQMELFIKEREILENQMEVDRKTAEISSLQSQINPHFLYNTLEVIRSEAIMNSDPEAAEMAEALANYFRYNISRKQDMVTVGEELDNVANYINIQKRRFGERVSYIEKFDSDENEIRMAVIPKLTLQPLVENAIFHGIEKKAGNGTVTMYIVTTPQRLIVRVIDDGPGMDAKTLEEVENKIKGIPASDNKENNSKHGGVALANINQRIKMIFGQEYGLSISASYGVGTEAEIVMPYKVKE